ncbi:MAG: alkaline phosphatase family protein [Flavobacteriales bacterium]|nr:alkaline phosphatase family protein [Flavobacteriales bacterium]
MHNIKTTFLSLFLLLFSWSAQGQLGNSRVLIIGVDGVRPDALEVANTPNMDALIVNGIFSADALNEDITMSGPGWSANLTGVWSDSHGVTNNDFTGSNFDVFPSFMKRLEMSNPGLNTHSVCHWGPINDYILEADVDEASNVTSDAAVASSGVSILDGDPHAIFLHLDDVDLAGHSFGYSTAVSQYVEAIENADEHIGLVIEALEDRPNYNAENWLVIVTTDHGGIGFGHGGNSLDEQNVFFIASGNSVPMEVIEKDTLEVLPPPLNCIAPGASELTFTGGGDNVYIPQSPELELGTDVDFTLELRMRTNTSPDVAMIGNKDWDSGLNPGFVFSFEYPSGPAWKVNISDGNSRADANGAAGISDGQWHTLSCSFDRDGTMKLYTDGVFSAEEDISQIGNIDVDMGWFLGSDIDGGYSFSGSLAELRFWHGLLDDETIANWHCAALTSDHPFIEGLQAHWELTEGSGLEIANSLDESLAGVITGATWQSSQEQVVFDYSNTPRIVDVPVTAMEHLCLEVDPNWNLDGISWVDGCSSSGLVQTNSDQLPLQIFPNPGRDILTLKGIQEVSIISVFNVQGSLIRSFATPRDFTLNTTDWPDGLYFIRVQSQEWIQECKWLKQN